MMRIAQITLKFSDSAGGAPRAIADHISAVQTQGILPVIFTGFSGACPVSASLFGLEDCEVVARPLIGPSFIGWSPMLMKELKDRSGEIDVIHLNGVWNLANVMGATIARKSGIPYIITGHSHLGEYHFSRAPFLKKLLYAGLVGKLVKGAAAIHITSDWELETSRQGIGSASTIKIPLAVDLDHTLNPPLRSDARQQLGIASEEFVVVSFGRVARQKNPALLLNAFLNADFRSNATLVFVGPQEASVKSELERMSSQATGGKTIRFVDFATGEDKRNWLTVGDVFALSSFDDNFCISAIEAAAMGTYSLLSEQIGAVEYLPEANAESLPLESDRWISALERVEKKRPGQRPADEAFREQFSKNRIGKQWSDYYGELLKKP